MEKQLLNRHRVFYSISTGLLCGLGAVVFFLFLGIGASLAGSSFSQYLIKIKPLVALFFLILGTLLVANISLDLSPIKNRIPMRFSANRNAGAVPMGGFFLYGFGYGLATTGCTFPIFLSLIVIPITSGRFLIGNSFI